MGMNFSFCSSEPYFSRETLPKEDSCRERVSLVAWIVENMKPTCLKRKKKKQKQKKERQQQLKTGKELTLEEWLLKSSIMENHGKYSGEYHDSKHRFGSDYPSVAGEGNYCSDSREYSLSLEQLLRGDDYTPVSVDYSISSEKLLKDEKVVVKEPKFNSLARSQSSKVKKRVSFRLPEVSDIIILHPSEMDFEE